MERFSPGDRVETAHGRHHALETGTVVKFTHGGFVDMGNPQDSYDQDWYRVSMDCGCCEYSFDVRSDGFGRIRAAR